MPLWRASNSMGEIYRNAENDWLSDYGAWVIGFRAYYCTKEKHDDKV